MEILPLISFFTGVISILSPCILPIIPIFVAFSLNTRTRSELIAFVCGLLSIFALVIFLTAFFTSIVYSYIFYVRIIAAALLLAIGIMMLAGHSVSFRAISPKVSGAFSLGLLTSVSWAPCYSAYLMSLIALLVSSNDAAFAAFNIALYCAGFGLTLLALSYLISRIDLERLILRTKYIPKIFGILVIIGAVYLLWESLKVLI